MRPSRPFIAIVATCALLLLPGSAIVSAQSTDEAPMMDEHAGEAQMTAPAMDSMADVQTMDPERAMMTEPGAMPAGMMMPETESAP
jgi:hypothetical protein